jgi:hypothetical protein
MLFTFEARGRAKNPFPLSSEEKKIHSGRRGGVRTRLPAGTSSGAMPAGTSSGAPSPPPPCSRAAAIQLRCLLPAAGPRRAPPPDYTASAPWSSFPRMVRACRRKPVPHRPRARFNDQGTPPPWHPAAEVRPDAARPRARFFLASAAPTLSARRGCLPNPRSSVVFFGASRSQGLLSQPSLPRARLPLHRAPLTSICLSKMRFALGDGDCRAYYSGKAQWQLQNALCCWSQPEW